MGVPPSNRELLDWLASEFVARGWSIKAMHRLIMTSRVYQRSSAFDSPQAAQIDPENRLLWRMNRRRLEAEALWDSIHSVAGTLNLKTNGRPVMPPLVAEELTNKSEWVVPADPADHTRRGIYIIVRRNFRFPLFDVFDAPVNAISCGGREVSTVAPQALWLLNNRTAFDQSRHLAARLVREAGKEPSAWIERLWRLAYGRVPTAEEVKEATALLSALETAGGETGADALPKAFAEIGVARAAALSKLCLTVLNTNEFIYVD